jgi:flagellar export protein FliJ
MKGLSNLIRLHKQKLDERRQKLAQMQAVAAGFTSQIHALEQDANQEAEKAGDNPESVHAIGSFVQATLGRRDALKASLADVQIEIDILQSEISKAFSEVKRFEVVDERREIRARRGRQRRERKTEDAIGLGIYQRRRLIAGA